MSELLEGRTALVTVGTSGIGRGIAEVLRMRGAAVAVTGATEARCEDARAAGFPAYRLDVRDRRACNEAVARAVSDLGGLSVLAWWYAVRTGARLDRENAARDAAQAQWEREHPDG